jgi:hypothetical protein
MTTKKQQILNLIEDLKQNSEVENIWVNRKGEKVNVGLINHFKLHNIIPNKWFDWVRSANAEVMVIGQDWGPYSVLKKFIDDFDESKYEDEEYYSRFIFRDFSSRTEKFILNTISQTYFDKFHKDFTQDKWDKIFFTMSVLFMRQGIHFRGSHNFDNKKSAELSYKYVARQLDIIKPKLIITLGNMGFEVVNKYFNLGYKEPKVTKLVEELEDKYFIEVGSTKILPNFHPAAHVDPKIQKKIWSKMWEVIEI